MNMGDNMFFNNQVPFMNPNMNINNDIFYKIKEIENRIKKLEQRIKRLEDGISMNNDDYIEPDTSFYMI